MEKVLDFLSKLGRAIYIVTRTMAAPLVAVVSASIKGEAISLGMLGMAFWRLIVWMAFLMCLTGNIGVPVVIAYLFLLDLGFICIQSVFSTVQ